MDWLLRLIGENWDGIAFLIFFPLVVWAELSNYPLRRNQKTR
ncbi:MAG: hypothetical protein RIR95_1005 [Pseudomonadota bacterium]